MLVCFPVQCIAGIFFIKTKSFEWILDHLLNREQAGIDSERATRSAGTSLMFRSWPKRKPTL